MLLIFSLLKEGILIGHYNYSYYSYFFEGYNAPHSILNYLYIN